MNDRSFAAGAAARTKRQGGDHGRQDRLAEAEPRCAKALCLDDIGDAIGAPCGQQIFETQADQQSANDRPDEAHIPGKVRQC